MLAWNSRRYFENNYLLIISISFLFVGVLDLLHTLSYKGMNIFQGYDANLPTQLWVVARYLQSLSLLIAPLLIRKKISINILFSTYFIIISLLLASIFYWKTFPDCYIEGAGLTQFKKTSEYIISFIFAASIGLLLREKKEFERRVLQLLITSITASILSEISFTTYVSVYGLSNLLGHFLKIISFYLLYKAIIETGIRRPYDLLFRNLKQSEEALKESENRYRLIAETSLDIIFQVDPQGIIAYCSPAVYKLGYTREEIVGKNFNGFLPAPELPKAAEAFQKVISGEYIDQLELYISTKDGLQRPFEINAAPVIANKTVIGIQGSARDITERKRMEERTNHLASFPQLNPNPVIEVDSSGKVIFSNPGTERILECLEMDKGEVTVFLPLDLDAILKDMEKNSDSSVTREVTVKDMVFSETICLTPQFNVARIYAFDITGHKQAEEALRVSEEKYRSIFEGANDGILACDITTGNFLFVNKRMSALTGYSEQEILKLGIRDLHLPEDLPHVLEQFNKQAAGEITKTTAIPVLRKDGGIIYCDISSSFLSKTTLIGFFRDVTESKRAEDALRQSKEDLGRAQEVGGIGSWRLDVRRNVLTWSDENHRIFGIPKGTPMTYETFLSTVHPDDRTYVDTKWKAGLGGEPYDIEHRLVVDGQVKWVREKAYLELDKDGALLGGFGITHDITKRKLTEETLRLALVESERRQAKISALLAASRIVLERREFKDTARSIFDFCKNLIGATSGYVALSSSDGTENELVFLDPGELSCTVDHSLPMPIRGLRGEVYRTGKALYNNNFSDSEYMEFIPEGHVRLDNVLFAPLIIKGYPVGLLGLANKPGGFTDDDADMASAFSELAAVALYNSRLLDTLQESEERFRSVVETACDGIISADSKGNVISWNKGAENIFGYAEDEIMGRPLTLIMPERFHEPHRIGFDRMASTCELQIMERILSFEGLRKDGSEFPLELSIATWKTGEEMFFTGIVRDVTERRKMEAVIKKAFEDMEEKVNERTIDLINANEDLEREIAERKRAEEALLETNVSLRESEKEYRKLSQEFHTLLNAIPDSIILLSPDMKMLWTNSGTASMLDMDRDDLTGHCCFEIWYSRTEPCEECPAVKSFKTGETETAQISTRKGRVFDIRAFPIKDENKNAINVIVVTSEITEKINLQAEAMRTAHLASLGEMAAGIAHEINNPINGIINYAQILADRLKSGRRENEIASQIIKEGDRVADIVRSLLSFARERKREKVPVYISDLLSDSFNLTGAQIRKDGIKLKVDIPDDLPEIIANSQQIQQVFLNIINNARYALNRKYPETDEDKILEVTAGKLMIDDKPYVRITFYDLGIGIPGDVLEKVVNPFFSTKPAGVGTGLGLSISHGIITDHNGKLTIKSLEGEFTNVIIDLPANTIGEE